MAENGNGATAPAGAPAAGTEGAAKPAMPQITMRILSQFIRDLSFENAMAQTAPQAPGTAVQPDIQVQVSLDAKKRETPENNYEVTTKYKINARNKADGKAMFVLELDYVGVFLIDGVPQEQLHPFLLIECPRMIFPFARRIVSDVTRDGGFPPLNLDNVDFLGLYRAELQRQAALKAAPKPA